MNIFTPFSSPYHNARILDDKRVIKMILETTQLLSNAFHINNQSLLAPYKLTHKNHPCSIWTAESWDNFHWLNRYLGALLTEYTNRYNKVHACTPHHIRISSDMQYIDFPKSGRSPFPNCTIYKNTPFNTDTCYQLYLVHKWQNDIRTPTWYRQSKSSEEIEFFFEIYKSLHTSKC